MDIGHRIVSTYFLNILAGNSMCFTSGLTQGDLKWGLKSKQAEWISGMDLSFAHSLPTERIIKILHEVSYVIYEESFSLTSLIFQRGIQVELHRLTRQELIDIYNKLVLPLPQRNAKGVLDSPISNAQSSNRIDLKRKATNDTDAGRPEMGAVKMVRNGIHELKIEQRKRTSSINDDPMDGSSKSKRTPITWP